MSNLKIGIFRGDSLAAGANCPQNILEPIAIRNRSAPDDSVLWELYVLTNEQETANGEPVRVFRPVHLGSYPTNEQIYYWEQWGMTNINGWDDWKTHFLPQ